MDATGQASLTCYLTDPSRVLRRRVAYQGRVRVTEQTLFDEPRLAEAFLADLANLRAFLHTAATPGPTVASVPARARETARTGPQGWEAYLDACAAFIGEDLVDYALGLPRLSRSAAVDPDDLVAELEGDSDLIAVPLPDGHRCPEPHRQRFRRFFERLAEASAGYTTVGRLLALRLILRGASGGYWNEPEAWAPVVARATNALGAPGQVHDNERAAVASLAAVGLAALRSQVPRFSVHDPLHTLYDSTLMRVQPLLGAVDPELVAGYTHELVPGLGPGVEPAAVDALILAARHPAPIDEAVHVLEQEWGIVADRHGQVIDLRSRIGGDPVTAALRAVGLAQAADLVAARATGAHGSAVVVWQAPQLVVIRRFPRAIDGARYQLKGLMRPQDYAVTGERLPASLVVERWSTKSPPPVPQAMLSAVGHRGDGTLPGDRRT